MKRLLRGLFDHARYHHETRDMPAWVRRRLYRELLDLDEEERKVQEMLDLDVQPRLCVVDEVRVAMLRPKDRALLNVDAEMARAREDEREEKRERQEARREEDRRESRRNEEER
ncbi:MAG: hypothetical protein R3270_00650 [Gammaproteobacteria bacterium]|nr:hypothetical protein [Gammaproteobacteria bacterium]